LREVAEDELGLDALIECILPTNARALDAGATIIGANNRDLQDVPDFTGTQASALIAETPPDSL